MENKAAGPGWALVICGVLSALLAVAGLVMGDAMTAWYLEQLQNLDANVDVEELRAAMAGNKSLNLVTTAFAVLTSGFVVFAGWMLTQGRGWTLGIVAAVFALIPCCLNCCVYPLALATGIWTLVVLMKPEVKQALTGGNA